MSKTIQVTMKDYLVQLLVYNVDNELIYSRVDEYEIMEGYIDEEYLKIEEEMLKDSGIDEDIVGWTIVNMYEHIDEEG